MLNERIEGTIVIVSALLVLFSAMLDPRISIVISIFSLASLVVYKLFQKDR